MRRFSLPWRGLTVQLFALTILPLTVLLVTFAFGSTLLHQRAMRNLVGERDALAVRTVAAALGAQLRQRITAVQSLASRLASDGAETPAEILAASDYLLSDFDGGLALIAMDGGLLAAVGDAELWQNLAVKIVPRIAASKSDVAFGVVAHPSSREAIVWIAATDAAGRLAAAGAFHPVRLVGRTLEDAFPPGNQTAVLVVDSAGQRLYRRGADSENWPGDHAGVAEALRGEQGVAYLKVAKEEHVVAYAPISPFGWGLVLEESWEMVSTPALRATQVAPLLLAPVLLAALVGLWFGARQIVQPLQQLGARADRLAWGDFKAIEEPVGGIAEIRGLQAGLAHMAQKVQTAQRSLHDYIGVITAAQEEERRRLARELHDDTLQALIALKQRVQLAQMTLHNEAERCSLAEIEALTAETIENLRRLTRALRPIYLEDLGLSPALEMLARETGQAMNAPVDFQRVGTERRLPPAIELALYRMAQEALSNVVRHAQATHAGVNLTFTPQRVTLEVTDNGKGFDVPKSPAEFAPGGHFGLLGLHERAELLGAKLEIQSAPGQGTRLIIQL